MILCIQLEKHQELMVKVQDMVYRKEIKGEKVPGQDKIYSIYEPHTDIIVKGAGKRSLGTRLTYAAEKVI